MQEQQQELLNLAEQNAQKILNQKLKLAAERSQQSELKSRRLDAIKFNSTGNERQFDHQKQILDLWEKSKMAIEQKETDVNLSLVDKGKVRFTFHLLMYFTNRELLANMC